MDGAIDDDERMIMKRGWQQKCRDDEERRRGTGKLRFGIGICTEEEEPQRTTEKEEDDNNAQHEMRVDLSLLSLRTAGCLRISGTGGGLVRIRSDSSPVECRRPP